MSIEEGIDSPSVTIPYCTGGWDTKNPLPSMPPQNAIVLDNMIVTNDSIVSREGYSENITDLDGSVYSLFEFANATSIQLISCTSAGSIYQGVGEAATQIGSDFAGGKWQGGMMNQYLLLFSGTDTPQKYDGTTLSDNVFTGSGLIPANLVGGTNFKNYLITWENNKCGFWYGDSDAISGPLTFFDLSTIARYGGYVISCTVWTYNTSGGSGLQARLVIILSTGEVLIYEGSNPGDATVWALIASCKIARPVSQRAILELGGDIYILTEYDLVSLTDILRNNEKPNTQSLLIGAISKAVASYKTSFGWQLIYYPNGSLIILNVPTSVSNEFEQYVVNLATGGASRFLNMNGYCFAVYNDNLYFGGDEVVYQGLNGENDNGEFITITARQAYSNYGIDKEKTLNYIKPYFKFDSDVDISTTISYDFKENTIYQVNQALTNSGNYWDTFYWDTVYWSSESEIISRQFGVSGSGVYISFAIECELKLALRIYSLLISYSVNQL